VAGPGIGNVARDFDVHHPSFLGELRQVGHLVALQAVVDVLGKAPSHEMRMALALPGRGRRLERGRAGEHQEWRRCKRSG